MVENKFKMWKSLIIIREGKILYFREQQLWLEAEKRAILKNKSVKGILKYKKYTYKMLIKHSHN